MTTTRQRIENQRYALMQRVEAFTVKHPFIGPIMWILGLQYFLTQLVVAAAWPQPYLWPVNLISDLGVSTICGEFDGRYVCSPLAWLMNISFVIFGLTIALGSLLIYRAFKRTKVSRLGFVLIFLSGIGGILVGLFTLNDSPLLHNVGATAALLSGNIGVILLGLSLNGIRMRFRVYTLLTGVISTIGFILFVSNVDLTIGLGNMERVVSYPYSLWMCVLGIYMTVVRLRS